MEKWRSKGRSKEERSILPPTKRSTGRNCALADKKKDRKWSFGGLLRRISSGRRDDGSSNEEDITYIPGHMLAKKQTKRVSKMRSKREKVASSAAMDEENAVAEEYYEQSGRTDTVESVASSSLCAARSQDSICVASNDSVNSPSSEGSLDALGKHSKISRMKARAEAKRDRLCENSSSDDDDDDNSHKSSQSSMKFRNEQDNATQRNVPRMDSWSRRTRGARTERYIKRMSRDDCNSGGDENRVRKSTDSPSSQTTIIEHSSIQTDSNVRKTIDSISSPTAAGSSSGVVRSIGFNDDERNRRVILDEGRYDSGASDRSAHNLNGKRETQECNKFTWPKANFRRTNPGNDIYGSLRARPCKVANEQQIQDRKVLPPEPPPRSSKSRIFSNISKPPLSFERSADAQQSPYRRCYEPTRRNETDRSCMSDNEILHDYRALGMSPTSLPTEPSYPRANAGYNSLGRTYGQRGEPVAMRTKHDHEDRWNRAAGKSLDKATLSFANQATRTTRSLPKGVELFSRWEGVDRAGNETEYHIDGKSKAHPIPRPRTRHESSQRPETKKIRDENEAERKRSSRNLQEALFELEAIYNSLRLSDPDLLDRAEERTMNEYRVNAAKNQTDHYLKNNLHFSSSNDDHDFWPGDSSRSDANLRIEDDMAYRRMNPKERPSSVNGQSSLSCISYLATSPNLSIRDNDRMIRPRSGRSSPDLMRDDLLFRSISHAMNTLKVIEPQPPFGIPVGPVTGSNESDYLHVKPPTTKHAQTRSLYIPKAEPDVVGDDLAFRNLRKDTTTGTNKNMCYYLQMDALIEPSSTTKYDASSLGAGTRKKRAIGSNTTDLNVSSRENNDWYNEYVRSSQKLSFPVDEHNFTNDTTASSYSLTGRALDYRNNGDLDINGNQPKIGLQRKIQIYVPKEISPCDNEKYIADNGMKFRSDTRDYSSKLIITKSADSERCCDSRNSSMIDTRRDENYEKTNIQQFTEQEISEYTHLCRDLEKLIRQTAADEETKKESEVEETAAEKAENDSQSEFDEWERLFNDDYGLPSSPLNLNEAPEVPSTEREDDRSSSTAGLSSENLASPSRRRIDKFGDGDDDLRSSASELGVCSKNGSLPDSVYEQFDRLLREVNDLPLVECTTKIGEYQIASNSCNIVSVVQREASPSPRDTEVYRDSRQTKGEIRGTLDDTSHALEYPSSVVSSKNRLVDRPLTNNLENLKSLTRRMRNEGTAYENRGTTGLVFEDEEHTEDKNASNDERHFLKGCGNMRPRSLGLSDESVASTQRDEFDKLVDDVLSSSPPVDLDLCSDNGSSTDSVYDKFDQLLREVNYLPVVDCTTKIGNYPSDELVMMTKDHENASAGFEYVEDDGGASEAAEESSGRPRLTSYPWESRTDVSSSKRHAEETRRHLEGRSEDTNNDTHGTMLEGKTRRELRTSDPNETFTSREGEKNIEDEPACNEDDACAFKETVRIAPCTINGRVEDVGLERPWINVRREMLRICTDN